MLLEMKQRSKNLTLSLVLFLVVSLLVSSSVVRVEARKQYHSKKNKHQKQKGVDNGNGSGPAPPPFPDYNQTQSTIFNIMSFGAKGNGVFDDSKALLAAWEAACENTGATLEIPSQYKFLIKPITLKGPCMPQLVLQIDGAVLAPTRVSSWPKSSLFQWLNFKWLHNFTIQGSGTVDGMGFNWWARSRFDNNKKKMKNTPDMKPAALRFYSSFNVTVRDITIINSPQCHLKFDNSGTVQVDNITISSPENSPNTDGIHLQNTQDVEIQHSNISCDDFLAYNYSLGGLGKDRTAACVSNIVVENISIQNTLSGVRIKTWQGGVGSVKNVSFSKIQVCDVKVPIMIDQYYCDKYRCNNQTGAVAISGITYNQIIGSYTVQPIHLACSTQIPCIDVDLIDIQLNPSSQSTAFQSSLCWNSYGKSQAPLLPSSIDYCLRSGGGGGGGGGAVRRIARSHDYDY
ncbi:Polygalacturonase, partial [Cucurbita argyrosperma subsp. argyrosperma]